MAEKRKKSGLAWKECPIYIKILRIAYMVIMVPALVLMIVAGIMTDISPYNWPMWIPPIVILLHALVIIIIWLVLEKKYIEKNGGIDAIKARSAQQAGSAPASQSYSAPAAQSAQSAASDEYAEPAGYYSDEPDQVETVKKDIMPKFLKWLFPLAIFGIFAILFVIGGIINLVSNITDMVDYLKNTTAEDFMFYRILPEIEGMWPYLVIGVGALLLAIGALIKMKKPEKLVYKTAVFPLVLFAVEIVFFILFFIYLQQISIDLDTVIEPADAVIAAFIFAIVGLLFAIATLVIAKVAPRLVYNIANAATYGWFFIYCIILLSNHGSDFILAVGKQGFVVVPMIFSLILIAYPFVIDIQKTVRIGNKVARPQPAPAPAPAKAEEAKAETPKAEEKGWYCPECGAYNTKKFCTKCGTKNQNN